MNHIHDLHTNGASGGTEIHIVVHIDRLKINTITKSINVLSVISYTVCSLILDQSSPTWGKKNRINQLDLGKTG